MAEIEPPTNRPLPTAPRPAEIARRLDRPLVLVGMMGAGKTALGRRLGHALGWPFIDADEEIEAAAQLTIAEIFAQFGEAYFRDGERRVIARLLAGENHDKAVVATGGGAFCEAETRTLILERALAIWLDADLETLVARTARRDHRPLLQAGDARATLARLKQERATAYAMAHLHITTDCRPISGVMARAVAAIDGWLAARGA